MATRIQSYATGNDQLLEAISHSQREKKHHWLSDWHLHHLDKAESIVFRNNLYESYQDMTTVVTVEILTTVENEYVTVEHRIRHDVLRREARDWIDALRKEMTTLAGKVRAASLRAASQPEGFLICLECEELMFEVLCTDNVGVEDGFDRNIEYMAEKHDDEEMLWVYDKLGAKREMLADRFTIVR